MLDKAKSYALKFLVYRPRSVQEVRHFLKNKDISQDIIDKVINYLVDLSYLDDKRFCELWIRNRMQLKPMGKRRLFNELIEKGIEPVLIEQVLTENLSEEMELNLAKELTLKKLVKETTMDFPKQQQKLKKFLYRRGFSFFIIDNTIKEIFSEP